MNETCQDIFRFLYLKDLDDLYTGKINDSENNAVYCVGCVLFTLSSSPFLVSGTFI